MSLQERLQTALDPDLLPPNWDVLFQEAQTLIENEPTLAILVQRYFPVGGNLQNALATRLADTLAEASVDERALITLFEDAMQAQPEIITAACQDLYAIRSRDPSCPSFLHAFLNLKGFQAVQINRVAHYFWGLGRVEIAAWLANRASVVIGADIHPAARIGTGVMLDHGTGIVIGETAVVEDDVSILQNVTLGGTGKEGGDRHPKVRHGVMIGAGAKVIGNIEIGINSKVAAGSVVLKHVPPNCTVAGIPAQIVRIHDAKLAPATTMDQSL